MLDARGAILAHRGFLPAGTHPLPVGQNITWSLLLPAVERVDAIVVRHLGVVVAHRSASASAPTVTILEPGPGADWTVDGPHRISWRAEDADGDPVLVSALYSADDGVTWWPLAMQSQADHIDINSALLPGSATARLRLTATDGVRTTVAELAGSVRVPDHAPTVDILGPAPGTVFQPGQPFRMEAQASDLEQPVLDDHAYRWTVDGTTDLGDGSWRVAESLTPGRHVLSVGVTDSAGHLTTASVNVVVEGADWNAIPDADPADPNASLGVPWLPIAAIAFAAAIIGVAFVFARRRRLPGN